VKWRGPSWLTWRAVALALGAGAIGFVAATLIFQPPTGHHPDWGDFPAWFAFIAAAIAGGVALTQLKAQQDQINAEAERNVKRDQLLDSQLVEAQQRTIANQRRQAEKIRLQPDGSLAAKVSNESERPIRDVACRMEQDSQLIPPQKFNFVIYAPGPPGTPAPAHVSLPAKVGNYDLATGRFFRLLAGEEMRATFARDPQHAQSMKYVIRFTDDAEIRWQLNSDMRLTSTPDNEW
jgi:hypothetical protein